MRKQIKRIRNNRWVLLAPLLIFLLGVGIDFDNENDIRVPFERAQEKWREGNYSDAVELYEQVYTQYPASRYAPEALWETATIHYVNQYHPHQALQAFQTLVEHYPESPRIRQAYLEIAEIHENELQDLPGAIKNWQRLLELNLPIDLRDDVLNRMGNAFFQLADFEAARKSFEGVVSRRAGNHRNQQANIRIGTILQLQKDYRRSIDYFRPVLKQTECSDCRLQAQLGLIESYEFLDELPSAIEIAESISARDYSSSMKQELLARLVQKRKYYEPGLWKAGK